MTTLIIRLINEIKIYVLLKIEMLLAIQTIAFDNNINPSIESFLCEEYNDT